jgi:phosphoenolpyruvate carboxykinase (GTP)
MKFGEDGRLYASTPRRGSFGVAARHELYKTNPNAMATVERTRSSPTSARPTDGDVWCEGKTGEPPEH